MEAEVSWFRNMVLDLGTQNICLGMNSTIIIYFTTCPERVLLPGGGGGYHFPLWKNTNSLSLCKSPALRVLVFLILRWASQVWSPTRWQSPKRPTSVLSFSLDRSVPNASTSEAPTYLHVLLSVSVLESRPECGPLYLSCHFADKIRIFLFCDWFI